MTDTPSSFTHSFTASELGTRNALYEIMTRIRKLGVAEDQVGGVEIALAEAVNNVVEHAYANMEAGDILIRGQLDKHALRLRVTDHGRPLPDGELPKGNPADIGGPRSDLPEGGFGWFMIRTLARDIRYMRENGSNHLQLTFDLIPPAR
ncbi:ATP-binding protein [Sedimentitalea nanhaiensis]|uniref:Serine/threonine-protein kinase RsbW n=1 Tax=Sedimentitalea nanhaiensis TaxID=999627 RepID=A0A1I7BZE9_9RHOB|nr:ATP-binding protein [Sedimentitalea nanhaiensis]SFT92525.1 serine/threonine-protein kinase RsbW [Sedimentitalea nanhaiensis]